MPESERPEKKESGPAEARAESGGGDAGSDEDAGAVVERLAAAVERLLAEVDAIRERAAAAEASHARLSEALGGSGRDGGSSASAADIEERLRRLSEENRRLRSLIAEAQERARKLRGRLMVVEDEL